MELFYLMFIIFYVLFLGALKNQWVNKSFGPTPEAKDLKITLLIPFRDESSHLPSLLLNLEKIIPPSLEIIFINDKSGDDSCSLISAFLQTKNLEKWKLLESAGAGKKAALTTGIRHAEAEIILTTDADCILPDNWHHWMSQPFRFDHVQLVAGPVMTGSDAGFFARFQQIEWAGILLMTHYFFSRNQPLMCSGANFAYRKSAFIEVGGYAGNEGYLSGDDEFLLKKVIRKFGARSAFYLKNNDVLVKTPPSPNLEVFLQQRIRWAGKWRLHHSVKHLSVAMGSFLVAMIQLGSFFLIVGEVWSKTVILCFWTIKVLAEKRALGKVLQEYAIRPTWLSYITTSFLHPVYLVTVALWSIRGKFTWKGRKSDYNF